MISERGKIFTWGSNDDYQLGRQNIIIDEEENYNFYNTISLENGAKPKKVFKINYDNLPIRKRL